jgi:transcriptional regulator with XRE-family HTH domain
MEDRNRIGCRKRSFADRCGLDRTYVGGIERGERNLALMNIETIASALKIRLLELFADV